MIRFKVPQKFEGLNDEGLTNSEAIQKSVRGYIASYHYKSPEWLPNENEEDREERWMWERVSISNSRFALSQLYFSYLDDLVPPDVAEILKQEILVGVGGEQGLSQPMKILTEEEEDQRVKEYLFKAADYNRIINNICVECAAKKGERVLSILILMQSSIRTHEDRRHDEVFSLDGNPLTKAEQAAIIRMVDVSFQTFSLYNNELTKAVSELSDSFRERVLHLGDSIALVIVLMRKMYDSDGGYIFQELFGMILAAFRKEYGNQVDVDSFFRNFHRFFVECRQGASKIELTENAS